MSLAAGVCQFYVRNASGGQAVRALLACHLRTRSGLHVSDYNPEAFQEKLTQKSTGINCDITTTGCLQDFQSNLSGLRGTCFPKVFGAGGSVKIQCVLGRSAMSVCFYTLFHHKDKMEAKSSGPNSLNCICPEKRQAKRQ